MLVDISKLRETGQPLVVETSFDQEALSLAADGVVHLPKPLQTRCRVTVHEDRVRVQGWLAAEMSVTCSRCLRLFSSRLEKTFDLEYAPDPKVEREGEELALNYEDLGVGFYRDEQLDLGSAVGEQILLEIPMKPLCAEDCRGLCDQCGADLNQGDCGCVRETVDPRLASLLELKKRLNNSN